MYYGPSLPQMCLWLIKHGCYEGSLYISDLVTLSNACFYLTKAYIVEDVYVQHSTLSSEGDVLPGLTKLYLTGFSVACWLAGVAALYSRGLGFEFRKKHLKVFWKLFRSVSSAILCFINLTIYKNTTGLNWEKKPHLNF